MSAAPRTGAVGDGHRGPGTAGQVPVKEGLFRLSEAGEPRLLGGACGRCERSHFPSHPSCPYCGSVEVDEILLSARGSLWAWTAVTAPPPGYRGDVPFGFGVVELPEGVRVVTRLSEPDPARLSFGQEMVLQVVPLGGDDEGNTLLTYSFAPAASG